VGISKGKDTDSNIKRHFGSPTPEGYRKALRVMKQAEKFHRPILALVNTQALIPMLIQNIVVKERQLRNVYCKGCS